jgi:hypothetical protein
MYLALLFSEFRKARRAVLINVGLQTHSPRRPVEMPSGGGPVPVSRPAGPWRQPAEEIEMTARE